MGSSRGKAWIEQELEWKLEGVKRPSKWGATVSMSSRTMPAFMVLRRRWVVERNFAWVELYNRMSKDYGYPA